MRSNIGEIDAVLLDVVMPIKDGYQVLMDMNMDENLKYLPVIVITADDDIESEHRACAAKGGRNVPPAGYRKNAHRKRQTA